MGGGNASACGTPNYRPSPQVSIYTSVVVSSDAPQLNDAVEQRLDE